MLLAQTHPPHETIVVDQTEVNATSTYQMLAKWAADERIIWLQQRERNASRARNAGALAATGDFVLFLDDDIRIGPDFVAAYMDVLQRTGAVGVSGPVLEGGGKTVNTLSPN